MHCISWTNPRQNPPLSEITPLLGRILAPIMQSSLSPLLIINIHTDCKNMQKLIAAILEDYIHKILLDSQTLILYTARKIYVIFHAYCHQTICI